MDKRKEILEELEFENPVEIRKYDEDKPKKGHFLYILSIFVLLAISGVLGYREFNRSSEINKIKQKLKEANQKLSAKEKEIEEISKQLEKSKSISSNSSKNKSTLLKNISSLEKQVKEQHREIKLLKKKIKTIQREVKRLKTENKKLKEREKKLQTLVAQKQKTLDQKEIELKELRNKLKQQEITLKNLRETFSMESNASKKLISELISEQKKNQKLLKENLSLKESIKKLKERVKRLERVEEGDMVPSSDYLTLAKPLVNPPIKIKTKGLFSRFKGIVIVNALIDEYGNVKNAYYVSTNIPEDKIDRGLLINRVLTGLKKWKFSPPLYKGKTPVKTWQPVVIPVQSQ